ncbi:cohesin subunit SA-2 isoform X2 [Brienomyrus brachyistius]|uniref:cohesin subunit SA-2 isoform X2 n=1 Tax=Brienomyrus brachyistius TaxID=42636 RepID=UPI0020B3354D|nr:cohesin subunit SA-2 isoform X2 [Brienomyrus brachyistius]
MIAGPALASWPSTQNQPPVADLGSSASTHHNSAGVTNENRQQGTRGKRRLRERSENAKRRHSERNLGSAERPQLENGDVEAVTLFEVVTMGKSAMQAVVDDWIAAYQTDRETALLDLISFFIQCSGCKGVVTAEMFQCKQDSDVMSKMVEELDEGSGLQYKKFLAFPWILTVTWPLDMGGGEYPLIMPGPYWKRFRSSFCEFVSVLVAHCKYSGVFDSYLTDTLISLLTELSDSRVRAFRHTCTLAAVKLLTALIGVALNLSVSVDNSQRLYEVERAKASNRRVGSRLEKLQRKIDELQDKKLEMENMMDVIFKGIFLKRYRDVIPEIRAICMEELGVWMRLYAHMFFNDSYLKYVGWMLYDKQPDVRLKCVRGLQGLYGDPLLIPKLDLFTSRFKERMLSMTLDKDHEVAVQALRLLMIISQSCDDILSAEDCNRLYQLVFAAHRPLASTAGEFLYTKLLSARTLLDLADGPPSERDLVSARVVAILQFFRESEFHQHVVYLVDSLWDSAGSLLKDWASLTSLLLQGAGLSCAQEGLLIEILLASVRQAAEGPPVAGRGTGKKVTSARERKAQADDCLRLTQHFTVTLPQLLSKYQEALLAEMGVAVERHSDAAVLEAAACTFQALGSEDTVWHDAASAARDQLVRRWAARLGALLGDALTPDGVFSADADTVEEILSVLKRAATFYNAQDLSQWGLQDAASRLLGVERDHGGVPHQVAVVALRCVCCSILWRLSACTETSLSREAAVAQRSQLRAFCDRCCRFLSHEQLTVREQAFLSLCDLLTAHSYQLQAWDHTAGAPLLYTPDPKLQRALLAFTLEHVFTGAEQDAQSRASESDLETGRLEDLHRRRNLLAAYCKLIVHGVLEMNMAVEVFKLYMQYYSDFGDIIKETLSRTRQMDKMESARTLVLCLQQLFLRLKQEQQSSSGSGFQSFSSIKELARRFSLTFGWDQIKSRESLAMIHRDGIEFVFQGFVQQAERLPPPNISYLTILSEFSSKLLKPDKKTVYNYLQKCAGELAVSSKEDCWLPLAYYRASLMATAEGPEDAGSHVSSDTSRQAFSAQGSRSSSLKPAPVVGEVQGNKTPELKSSPVFIWPETKGRKALKVTASAAKTRQEPKRLLCATDDEVNVDAVEVDP